MLTYLEIAQRLRPRWIVWENVPGVLSSGGGRDFGSFLGALGELGYGWAYRVLDAQWCRTHGHPRAVPQRRRRVFVVGCLGDWERAAAVLFERESMQRDPAPRRAPGQGVAADAEAGVGAGCWPARVASTLNHAFGDKFGLEDQHALNGAPLFVPDVVGASTAKGPTAMGALEVDAHHYVMSSGQSNASVTMGVGPCLECCHESPILAQPTWPAEVAPTLNQSARGTGAPGYSNQELFAQGAGCLVPQPVPFTKAKRAQSTTDDETWVDGKVNPTLSLFDQGDTRATTVAVAFHPTQDPISSSDSFHALGTGSKGGCATAAVAHALRAEGFDASEDGTGRGTPLVPQAMTVRRLTPRECERLQGFPDDWTLIPWRKKPAAECPDGPRYKALGNSMAVNCMAWIGERIAAAEEHQ